MHDEWPDDALYGGLVKRDPLALEALMRRYSREMSYFIRVVLDGVGTSQDAEECASDLLLWSGKRLDRLIQPGGRCERG